MIEENGTQTLTPRQIASQKNGAKSKGPKTEEGKKKISLNALKHGLCAASQNVLKSEDPEAFESLKRSYYQEFEPESPSEIYLVEKAVSCAWRSKRVLYMEKELFEKHFKPHCQFEQNRLPIMILNRYEAAIERTYNDTIKKLTAIKKARPPKELATGSTEADLWQELLDTPDSGPYVKPAPTLKEKWDYLRPEVQERIKPDLSPEDRKTLGIE